MYLNALQLHQSSQEERSESETAWKPLHGINLAFLELMGFISMSVLPPDSWVCPCVANSSGGKQTRMSGFLFAHY